MTRIIGGQARGRRLAVPGSGTRPTSDRVREAMFASIESRLSAQGRSWEDIAVCDLWAGSGAVALEAWSRGAHRVVAIDKAKPAADAISSNISELGADKVRCTRADVRASVTSAPPSGPFDVVFADPPYEYATELLRGDLASAIASGWFGPDALVIIERSVRSPSPFPEDVAEVQQRAYGDSALWYGRIVGRPED